MGLLKAVGLVERRVRPCRLLSMVTCRDRRPRPGFPRCRPCRPCRRRPGWWRRPRGRPWTPCRSPRRRMPRKTGQQWPKVFAAAGRLQENSSSTGHSLAVGIGLEAPPAPLVISQGGRVRRRDGSRRGAGNGGNRPEYGGIQGRMKAARPRALRYTGLAGQSGRGQMPGGVPCREQLLSPSLPVPGRIWPGHQAHAAACIGQHVRELPADDGEAEHGHGLLVVELVILQVRGPEMIPPKCPKSVAGSGNSVTLRV